MYKKNPDINEGSSDFNNCDRIPSNVAILEGTMYHSETKKELGRKFSKFLINNYGDADVNSSDGNHRIDPALKFYSGIPLMINHNRDLVKTGRVNGT